MMTYKSRLIKVNKNKASIAEIFEFDLSDIPEDMTFDQYIQTEEFKKRREELFNALVEKDVKTRYLESKKQTKYIIEDDTKEKEAE